MIYRQLFDRFGAGKTVRAGLIGAGHFATAIVTQSAAIRRLDLPVVAELDVELARKAYRLAGYAEEDIALCSSRGEALQALEHGRRVVVPDGMLLMDLPLDVIIECTGEPEAAARYCEEAIRHGKHVANVSKEMDVVVGPILKHLADRAGVVYGTVDGDQPGLLIGLVEWARELGLEVLSGGKSLDAELIYDPVAKAVTDGRRSLSIDAESAELLNPIVPGQPARVVAARNALLQNPRVFDSSDLVEMAIVANGTGLMPDVEELHCPPLRTPEIPEVLCPIEEGGILHRRGAIDSVIQLRFPYEAGLGGGVWIVVACENEYSRDILTMKGLIPNSRGSAMLIYRPHHLCGVETPISALCAGLLGVPTGATELKPRVDVVAQATRDLTAGDPAGYDCEMGDLSDLPRLLAYWARLEASMRAAGPVEPGRPLPIMMAHGLRLRVDVPAGTTITADMVVQPSDSRLWALRAEQDKLFFAQSREVERQT